MMSETIEAGKERGRRYGNSATSSSAGWLVGMAVCVLTSACGGSDKPKTVGPEGGTVSKDGASVVVPKGALDTEVEVEVERANAPSASLDDDKSIAGDPYALTPHGTTFKKPVEVTIPVHDDATGVARLDDDKDETWADVPETMPSNGRATFETSTFSIYVGIKDIPPNDPLCPATEPNLGDSCDVSVECTYGDAICTCQVMLWACL
jgi:hypothetical protein